MYHANLIGGVAARMAGFRNVIWGIHNSDLNQDRNKRSTIIVNQICAILSYIVPQSIVNCSVNSMRLHCMQGYSSRKCVVIPNGFDITQFGYSDRITHHEYRIGNVARMDPQKDHGNILHAFALVLKTHPGSKLILCGSNVTVDNVQLQAWINQYGVNDRVELLGPRQDIPNILNSLDVFVLGSCGGEAFPLVLGEAMACGVPCVTTDVGDSARIVGDTGWIVPPRDPQALASAIIEALAESFELRALRGHRCRQRILENFEISRVANMYYDLWAQDMNEGKI
jgi:glycosyltransferase involved in cell wall biosynthesis